jgi:TRAP-type uncharacterized transport system fused permease subunit
VLVWALMVERLSPGLSAFWAVGLHDLHPAHPAPADSRSSAARATWAPPSGAASTNLIDGLIAGARNMIGIGIATATAGIIVGAVSQTGVGSALADVVEVLSGGNCWRSCS